MSHIDRVFCNIDFDSIFPLATARALPRNPSDHVPIMWESGYAQKSSPDLTLRNGGCYMMVLVI
jgi:hypothetical protein